MNTKESPYLRENDLAEYLSVNQQTIARLRKKGLISGIKLNRSWYYRKSDIDRLFDTYANCDLSGRTKIERKKA